MSQIAFVVSDISQKGNRLFDNASARDGCLERFVELRNVLNRNWIYCDTADMCDASSIDVLACSDIGKCLKEILAVVRVNPFVRILYIATEPPAISVAHTDLILGAMPFDRILSWNDDFVSRYPNAAKCNIGQPIIDLEKIPCTPYEEKGFLVAIYSNKKNSYESSLYKERLRAFEYFAYKPGGIDLYGVGWSTTKHRFILDNYKGPCEKKKDVLRAYKFSICFENTNNYPGYISEKMFDCFASGTVPVYYGAPNVSNFIPKNCFIDFREFNNYDDLYNYLWNMGKEEYDNYLNELKKFVTTRNYYEFTSKSYAEVVAKEVNYVLTLHPSRRTVLRVKWHVIRALLNRPWYVVRHVKGFRRLLIDLLRG